MKILATKRLGFALAAMAMVPLAAQDPSVSVKLRAGSVYGAVSGETLSRRTVGFGLEGSMPLSNGAAFTAELTYDFFPGYQRETTAFSGPVYYTSNWDPANPSDASTTYDGKTLLLRPDESLQAESNQMLGFGLRLGYRSKAPWLGQDWEWQAGISLDHRQTHHEVFMTLTPVYKDGDSYTTIPSPTYVDGNGDTQDVYGTAYYEGAGYSKDVKKWQPGIYAGVTKEFMDFIRAEVNVRYSNFTTYSYHSFTKTGKAPHYTDASMGGLVVEVSIGFKL